MNRAYAILAVVLLVVLGVGVASLSLGQADDKTMIQDSLRKAEEATRKGEPGGVLELLSRNVTVNGEDQSGNENAVIKYIKSMRPDIEVTNPNPIISGDEAHITSPVRIHGSLPIVGDRTMTVKDVVLTFRKEASRAYLVVPVKKWRLTGVQAPENAWAALSLE